MYSKTYDADTIDEALQQIKRELGPDAIILKTVTNKGIKGAFKKKKYEVTAAITEKDYKTKAKADSVLTPAMKEKVYNASSADLSRTIDYLGADEAETSNSATYGRMGLNKIVKQAKETIKTGLDDFLGEEIRETKSAPPARRTQPEFTQSQQRVEEAPRPQPIQVQTERRSPVVEAQLLEYEKRIEQLERKMAELSNLTHFQRLEDTHLQSLRTQLLTLGIEEKFIQVATKKMQFELRPEEMKNYSMVEDFNLKLMADTIQTAMPLFSNTENREKSVITVLLSAGSCGQSSLSLKVAKLKDRSVVIRFDRSADKVSHDFSQKISGTEVILVTTIAEAVSQIKRATESMRSVFVDYVIGNDIEETKKFIEGLHRSFPLLEVLLTLSAIHTQHYNLHQIQKVANLIDGVNINHMDQCLDIGMIFNLSFLNPNLKLKFFGTGKLVPDDVELASSERILGSMFNLK